MPSIRQGCGELGWVKTYASCAGVSKRAEQQSMVCTHNGNFSAEMVLDLARFDRVRGMFLDDLGELCKLLEGR